MNVFLALSMICAGLFASGMPLAKSQPILPATTTATIQPTFGPEHQTQRFEGVIVSKNGQLFVLRDEVNNAWYHLDDQQAAGKYLGKKVLVTGILDARTDVIRVQSIAQTG